MTSNHSQIPMGLTRRETRTYRITGLSAATLKTMHQRRKKKVTSIVIQVPLN